MNHETVLTELQTHLTHIKNHCSPADFQHLKQRVEAFATTAVPDTALAHRELLKRGLGTLHAISETMKRNARTTDRSGI